MPKLPPNMVRRKGRNGYYFRKKVHGRDRWMALGNDYQDALIQWRRLQAEPRTPLSQLIVSKAARRWLSSYIATNRKPKGQVMAEYRVRRYLEPFMGHLLVSRVTKEHLRGYRLHLESLDLSARSVSHVLSDARCFFYWAADVGLVDVAPIPKRLLPRIQEEPPDRLTDAEAELLRQLPEPHGFVCRLALGSGLRWGELCRAQASDVQSGVLVVHQTKSRKLRRVPLTPELLSEIGSRVGRLCAFAERSPGSFAKAVRKATGISGFHVHQMRHTFACQWADAGGNIAALQQVLGHASIETTQRYARLSDSAVERESRHVWARRGSQRRSHAS